MHFIFPEDESPLYALMRIGEVLASRKVVYSLLFVFNGVHELASLGYSLLFVFNGVHELASLGWGKLCTEEGRA